MDIAKSVAEAKCGIDADEIASEKYSNEKVQEYIETKRAAARELYVEQNQSFINKNLNSQKVIYLSKFSPVVLASLNKAMFQSRIFQLIWVSMILFLHLAS